MRLLRPYRAALACLVLALLVGLVAIVDHRWKQTRINRVQLQAWYCSHQGIECNHGSWVAIERHWNERQVGYEIVVGSLGITGIALAARRALRR